MIGTPSFTSLHGWFLVQALPLWSCYGVDRQSGGFFEKLYPSLNPTNEPRRTRLVARQIYWFTVGEALGWQGAADELIDHGFQFLSRYLVSPEGHVRASCTANGDLIDSRQHLYDVAFVLVALARQAHRRPDSLEPEALARRIVNRLRLNPHGGYHDDVTPDVQCANPHMHLFEAFLCWSNLQDNGDDFWCHRAAALAQLAVEHMIQPQFGALPEHFDLSWRPIRQDGFLRIEPGHQFEWSWLLAQWASFSGDSTIAAAAQRLCHQAEVFGVDKQRNVVIECINDQLLPSNTTARLWQQTERLKAWHHQTQIKGLETACRYRDQALESLLHFLSGPRPGLWFDEMDSSGRFLELPVKASSGYHIACAIEELFVPIACR
ncbi:AGE family epimerase/isomerase [Synechococcus sp. CBW1002]|uniref:AGE family epimerase/isomerase n=1 Tax=Synechococcus sp. CBW1002 TaxID=1353134 RepID=UPI0018CD1CF1|nr:AGE family epimerase/isomerase [Synechococcus sp. CBW1002]QPN59141.1 AGE family epimerase/isomerase [Synechococcus sp. CBW1002]